MSIFWLYLNVGINHISDFKGYDHILFICSLCAIYQFRQILRVSILITAFTLGHTCTLALATLNILHISSSWIEFLIPLTIFLTALINIANNKVEIKDSIWRYKYLAAMFFGLIHGLGFSTYLRGLLGNEEHIVKPLFAFNIGIEIGQLAIVLLVLTINYLIINTFRFSRRDWTLVLSGAGMGISIVLMFQRIPW